MRTTNLLIVLLFMTLSEVLIAQSGIVKGEITVDNKPAEFAQVSIDEAKYGTVTNSQGKFTIKGISFGVHQVVVSFVGYAKEKKEILISKEQPEIKLTVNLSEQTMQLDDIVVTGTKTHKRKTNSPVIVNVVDSKILDHVQACNLSDGLKFQPGLRVETDCQTCNYTQLRMNGLAGGYSQILINGRPIFSPLTGLYGMEQLPANMIDRIEVVRGGASSLYGSSAIGGTVNMITKIPTSNNYELNYTYQNISSQTGDNTISGNATMVSENRNSGISFFLNHRERALYDANGDNFSEIPLIKNTSVGTNIFFLPSENQKLELNISYINEYRYGGEMLEEKPAYLAKQSEERTHNVWMSSADYQINFNDDNSSFIAYMAWQNTDRKHYTGIIPDKGSADYKAHFSNPPYGTSDVSTYNVGAQINHRINNFLNGKNVFTLGAEYVYDDVRDEIDAYEYLIDQTTKNYGFFLQSDWEIISNLTLLSGIRFDKHNLLSKAVLSPRVSMLYKYKGNTQFRLSYGTGFRAPQAFDTDLHIAFAGGGVSRVSLSPDLKQEKSQSFSGSINYDKPMEHWIAGFTVEGFYTQLNDAFYLQPVGEDKHGELFEKQNGDGAVVKGITLELRANYNRKLQLESGFTIQSSKFNKAVEYIEGIEPIREFTRTPNDYGYAILTISPSKRINVSVNYVYTGTMQIPHFAGAVNQSKDEIITSAAFSDLSSKLAYIFPLSNSGIKIEVYGGVKNILNSYQNDFDIGKNRDSNFIYGASQPITYFVGIKLRSK